MLAHDLLKMSRGVTATLLCVGMSAVIAAVQLLAPDKHHVPLTHNWSPILCGAILGALQVPLFLFLQKNMGSSSSFVTVASTAAFFTGNTFQYLAKFRPGFANWWQVVYVASAAIGAAIARASVPHEPAYDAHSDGLSVAEAIVGGFLIIFGARMANGCTSGHGITGMAHLAIRSMIAVSAFTLFASSTPAACQPQAGIRVCVF